LVTAQLLPRSTLFPYTTLFRSLVGPKMDTLFDGAGFIFGFRVLPAIIFVTALVSILYYIGVMGILIRILGGIFQKALNISKIERSEEHTSELQSRFDLVCRLLL